MGILLQLTDENNKSHKLHVKDVKNRYPVNGLIKYLPDGKAFGHAAKYDAHPKHLEDLHWSLNEMHYLIFKTVIQV